MVKDAKIRQGREFRAGIKIKLSAPLGNRQFFVVFK